MGFWKTGTKDIRPFIQPDEEYRRFGPEEDEPVILNENCAECEKPITPGELFCADCELSHCWFEAVRAREES